VRLVWAGAAPEGLPGWIVPLGPVPQERLAGAYATADVLCAPSLCGESFGIILAESMAAGTPVVCSDLPGYREAAADAAVFAPPGDAAAVARALLDLLEDRDRSEDLVKRGRKRVAALDWKVVAADVMACYEDAIAGW